MGGFIGTGGCDPDIDPGCLGPVVQPIGPPIVIVSDTGTAAAIGDVSALQQALGGAVGDLKSLAGLILNGIAQVLGLLALLWSTILKPLLEAIRNALKWLNDVLNKVLKPYLDWMRQMRQLILQLYNTWIRPIIVVIESLRRVIRIFRLLHIHVFDGLDRQLARIEGKLLRPIYAALYRINTLGNWVSFILNAHLVIFRGLFLQSLQANQGGAFSLLASTPAYGFAELPHVDTTAAPVVELPTFDVVSAAIAAATPDILARAQNTPAAALVDCWETSIGSIELRQAVDDVVNCVLS